MGNIDWGFSWAVVAVGIVVVFVVLLALVVLTSIMGKVFTSINNDEKKHNKTKNAPATSIKPQGGTATINMVKDEGICDDVVAAISAAIAVIMSDEGVKKPFVIKSIKREKNSRSNWNFAGISENTRPF